MAHLEEGKIPIRFEINVLFSRAGRQRLAFLRTPRKRFYLFSTKNFCGL